MKLAPPNRISAAGLVFLLLILAAACSTPARNGSHYVFLLPDGYVGWVQVVFARSVTAKPVIENGNLLIDLDDGGIFKTSAPFQIVSGSHDEFFYKRRDAKGNVTRASVPGNYVCAEQTGIDSCYEPSEEHGSDGFTVGRVTAGKEGPSGDGNSWFLFIGPPALRAKHAAKVVFAKGEQYLEDHPENDPIPGRIKDEQPKQ